MKSQRKTSRAAEPPWLEKTRRAPKNHLSREAIVKAALRIVDKEGLDALSMRRLAEGLRTGPASLYWHVHNREELLHLMIDAVAGEISLPEPDPMRWQEQLKEGAREMRRVFLRHGDLARATMGRIPMGPNIMRLNEQLLALLRRAGLPDRVVALVTDLLSLYVGAHAMEQAGGGIASPTGEPQSEEAILEMYKQYFKALPADQFPNTLALADALFEGDEDARFEFGLDVLVSGLGAVAKKA